MSESEKRLPMAPLLAYVSLALAISVQAGAAIWWSGQINTRVAMVERQVEELRDWQPVEAREITAALQSIAVIEERLVRVDQNLARLSQLIGESRP